MGFGTLFFGYFILLDLPYQTLTNVCAAALMLFAFCKLAYLNEHMKRSLYICTGFLFFALYEAVVDVLGMVFSINVGGVALNTFSYMLRNLLIGTLSLTMLFGMRDVAYEVGLKRLGKKCDIYSKITLAVYVLNLCIPPDFVNIFGESDGVVYTAYVLNVISVLATLYVILMNCFNIHACYANICMPSDNADRAKESEKSKIGFVNKFRQHEEEKRREYADYRIEKMKKRQEKRNNKNK